MLQIKMAIDELCLANPKAAMAYASTSNSYIKGNKFYAQGTTEARMNLAVQLIFDTADLLKVPVTELLQGVENRVLYKAVRENKITRADYKEFLKKKYEGETPEG